MYNIQHWFICRPSDSTVSEDAWIELGTVATTALAVRRSNHSARSHPPFIGLSLMAIDKIDTSTWVSIPEQDLSHQTNYKSTGKPNSEDRKRILHIKP